VTTPQDPADGVTRVSRWASPGAPTPSGGRLLPSRGLLPRYEAYRRHQVRELLSLLPPEGLRALYREARTAFVGESAQSDPMAVLGEFVKRLMPLPPFHVWYQDVRRNPERHLDEPWMADVLPDRSAPAALDARTELLQGAQWRVELRVHHTGDGWRGHLSFRREKDERTWRTGDVFREPDAQAVLGRFREFDRITLEAFLRSVLP